ncbi:MAG: maleylpyruvate isomerase family mycothiol-dependent enzyme [Nocardioides sp.]
MDHSLEPDHLTEAGQRLVRTVDGFTGDDWSAPSLLPGWSRAHVVAHLALNGEALRDVLVGAVTREPIAMYASAEERESDIGELVQADHAELRERLLAVLTTFQDATVAVPDDVWSTRFERTPGGPTFPLASVPLMRVREIEIHHADLGAGYTADQWPITFAEVVVDGMVKRLGPESSFRVTPLDSERSWEVGEVGEQSAIVTGPVTQLAWWLTGREPGDQVVCSRGDLPTIGAW